SAKLPGFGRDSAYERVAMPVSPDLAEATARAERISLVNDALAEAGSGTDDDPFRAFLAIARAMAAASERHPDPVSWGAMADGAIDGALQAFDPASRYMTPEEVDGENEEESGKTDGFGFSYFDEDSALRVSVVEPGSPAFAAGLRGGDRIVALCGTPAAEMDADERTDAIDSCGGVLRALVAGADSGTTNEIAMGLGPVVRSSVRGAVRVAPGIGYLCIEEFHEGTPDDFAAAFAKLSPRTLSGLVIDLRDNPGGVVEAAVEVAGNFLPDGATMATTKGRVPEEDDEEFVASGAEAFPGMAIAVIVNGGTASAAELLAAALRDNGRATVVGSKTYGKGTVQSTFDFRDRPGSALRITTAHYRTPSGADVHGKGIEPDVKVPQGPDAASDAWAARRAAADPETFSETERKRLAEVRDAPLEAAVKAISEKNPQSR
ncbi:MAG: PDZ domain-containing protein, partial [Kiritimatiellae bacterium]|nr:PDZ domain-containing protein [Kiritimatiellia bacterium]